MDTAERELLQAYEGLLSKSPRGQDEDGRFYYIPLSNAQFLAQLKTARIILNINSTPGRCFIDVGCGIGSKVFLANGHGFHAHGIEFREEYVEVAKKLVSSSYSGNGCKTPLIIKGDALKFDYSQFDVIYFYCPIANYEKEKELEKLIIKTAKPGAVILANNYRYDVFNDKSLKSLGNCVFVKKRSKQCRSTQA